MPVPLLCKFVKTSTSLNHVFDIEKRLEQKLPQMPHDLSELTSFLHVSVTKIVSPSRLVDFVHSVYVSVYICLFLH